MSKLEGDNDQRRFEAVLRQLLTTPPQPRDQRKLGKGKPTRKSEKRASDETPAPSA